MKPTKPRPRAAAIEEAIIVALFDIANHLNRRGERIARRSGLTTQQWLVLLEIGGDPGFRRARRTGRSEAAGVLPSEIAAARGVTRATVSALVAQLLRLGLIRQVDDSADGRRRRLQVTADGRRALAELEPERRKANRRLLAALPSSDRAAFLHYLQSCLSGLVAV